MKARLYPFIFVVSLALSGCASMAMVKDSSERTSEVVETTTQPKTEAYNRIMRWAAQSYGSAQDVIQRSDPETGTIVLAGITDVQRAPGVSFPRAYNLTIDVRDERIRFTYTVGESSVAHGLQRNELERMMTYFTSLRMRVLEAVNRSDNF